VRRPKSDIPTGATERVVRKSKQTGPLVELGRRDCIFKGECVGYRTYDTKGRLQTETSLNDGKKHGREFTWNDDGSLLLVEPYFKGLIHGTAKQYDRRGRVIGAYKMVYGTGYDVWRTQIADGPVYVSEIHSSLNGSLHGFVWWLDEDQKSVHEEKHWYEGKLHGLEREWNFDGKLRRGFPKYWINDRAVSKRQYIAAARKDPTLPPFRVKDNSPKRKFPPEIRQLLGIPKIK